MFIRMLLALVLIVCGGASARAVTGDDIAGTVMAVQGQVTVTSAGQSGGPAAVAMPVHSKDTITTAPDARAIIVLTDESVLAVGGGAQIVIDDYRFIPENIHGNLLHLRAVRGALHYETGLLGRLARPDIVITLSQGKILPRESRLWAGPDGDSTAEDTPYHVYSAEGRVNIQTRRGSVLLDKGEAVLLTDRRSAPARVMWTDDEAAAALMRVTVKDQEAAAKRITDERTRLREARGQSAIETAIIAHENAEKMQDNFPLPPASSTNTNIAPAADTTPDVGLGQDRGGAARTALD